MAANSVRCPRDRGESVKGGPPPPCHKSTMTNRNSPPRAAGAQGSFDSRARSGWESGSPTPAPPAPGSPCGSRRTSEGRREAPGGPRTGPQLQAELRPKAIPDQGPVRGPLDPDCRPEVGVPLPARRRASWGYAETGAIPLFEVRAVRCAAGGGAGPKAGAPGAQRHAGNGDGSFAPLRGAMPVWRPALHSPLPDKIPGPAGWAMGGTIGGSQPRGSEFPSPFPALAPPLC